MKTGYAKFKEVGEALKKGHFIPTYKKLPLTRLKQLKKFAEDWLNENENTRKYPHALKRYEAIVEAIKSKGGVDK